MILDHQKFEYKSNPLIERVIVKPPFRHEALFEDEGCFLYFKGNCSRLHSSDRKENLNSKESVLLSCGRYYVDFLAQSEFKETVIYAIHLNPEILKTIYAEELPPLVNEKKNHSIVSKIGSEEVISGFIKSIDFYFQNPLVVNDQILELKVKELILILIQTHNVKSILLLIEGLYNSRKIVLRQVIGAHKYSNLSVEQLAGLSNMSLSTFKREFNREYGVSCISYINQQKIEKASKLLKNSGLSIQQIAYETGYSDPAYFSKQFKKKKGFTPVKYRESTAMS